MKPFRPPFRTGNKNTNATTAWSLKMFVNEKGVGRSTAIMCTVKGEQMRAREDDLRTLMAFGERLSVWRRNVAHHFRPPRDARARAPAELRRSHISPGRLLAAGSRGLGLRSPRVAVLPPVGAQHGARRRGARRGARRRRAVFDDGARLRRGGARAVDGRVLVRGAGLRLVRSRRARALGARAGPDDRGRGRDAVGDGVRVDARVPAGPRGGRLRDRRPEHLAPRLGRARE